MVVVGAALTAHRPPPRTCTHRLPPLAARTKLFNVTIANNTASSGGGAYQFNNTLDARNSIMWGNSRLQAEQRRSRSTSITADITCFLQQYSAAIVLPSAQQQAHYSNCDNSTTFPQVNTADFTCFLHRYAAGCH